MSNLEEFKSFLQFGVSRPHSYKVEIDNPIRGIDPAVNIMAEEAEIPGKSYATGTVGIFGPAVKFPYQEIYTDLTIAFICSSDMWEKVYFDDWQFAISNPKNGYFYYPDTYTKNIKIRKLTESDTLIWSGVAKKAWPITIDPLPLSYKETNSYNVLRVTFAYSRFIDEFVDDNFSGDSGVSGPVHSGRRGTSNLPVPGAPVDQ